VGPGVPGLAEGEPVVPEPWALPPAETPGCVLPASVVTLPEAPAPALGFAVSEAPLSVVGGNGCVWIVVVVVVVWAPAGPNAARTATAAIAVALIRLQVMVCPPRVTGRRGAGAMPSAEELSVHHAKGTLHSWMDGVVAPWLQHW
jgi:hypothetical protein